MSDCALHQFRVMGRLRRHTSTAVSEAQWRLHRLEKLATRTLMLQQIRAQLQLLVAVQIQGPALFYPT